MLVPIQGETIRVLTESGEVVYCGYIGRYGTPGHYGNFGCGCFHTSRRVYESMPPPWFDFGYDETLTEKRQCECARFAGRLQAAGVEPIQVGVVGRRTELVLIPSGRGRMRIVSPHELRTGEIWFHLSRITCGLHLLGAECVPAGVQG